MKLQVKQSKLETWPNLAGQGMCLLAFYLLLVYVVIPLMAQ